MDFFGAQSSTRTRSRLLVVLFVVALALIGVAIHVSISGAGVALGLFDDVLQPTPPVLALTGIVWATVLLGSLFRWLDVRAGGLVLARRFGAVQASARARLPAETVLLDVVAEVAIAASCPVPATFVLRNEPGINALVLGAQEDKRALVVTRGALDAYDRDELQAVVAHEFGHIVAGDLALNMRLMVALGGLNALDEVGRLLIGKDADRVAHPGMLVGYALRAIGSLGVLLGGLLRAAVSREREYLADASAVQFTRNSYALASALSLALECDGTRALQHRQSGELLHLCFTSGRLPWYRRLIATHPPLAARVKAIDPHFAVKRRKLEKRAAADVRQQGFGGMAAATSQSANAFGALQDSAGPSLVSSADINGSGLSDRLLLLLPDERSCLAVLFCLFAPADPIERAAWLDSVRFSFDEHFAFAVRELLASISGELDGDRLGIVEHATGMLATSLKPDNRQRVMSKLESLVRASGGETLMSYATLQLVRRKLDVEFPIVRDLASAGAEGDCEAQGRRVKTFDAMGEEFALLLSLMIESSGSPAADQDAHYAQVLTCYTSADLPRRSSSEPGIVAALERAFQTLYVQPQPIRKAFVEHCIEIARHDGRIERRELALLELFAASLGCRELALRAPVVTSARSPVGRALPRAA